MKVTGYRQAARFGDMVVGEYASVDLPLRKALEDRMSSVDEMQVPHLRDFPARSKAQQQEEEEWACPEEFTFQDSSGGERTLRGLLLFSREFVETHLQSAEDVLFVLLHELYHKLHGDLYRFCASEFISLEEFAANIVADIRINAELCRRWYPQGVPLLDRLYHPAEFPSLLMLPPHQLLAAEAKRPGFRTAGGLPPGLGGVARLLS